ncbi:MAG: prefoldin subunit alpha [Thaumarchaeota archaeon]|nr:prefoldin subunit alpha [Nitrososphaerota archaeon]
MSSIEENLARAVAELQALERAISELQSNIATLRALLTEYEGAISLIEELKKHKDAVKILVPIGGGNFLHAEVKELQDIQVSLGAGVMMKQPLDRGYELMKKRKENIGKAIEIYENRITQYAQRAEELRRLVEALSARLRERQKAESE